MGRRKFPEIPDWTRYKVGPHTPMLVDLQDRLAAKGLKDPWIRNEVWRHDLNLNPCTYKNVLWQTVKVGIWGGLGLGIVSAAIYNWMESKNEHHVKRPH